MSLFMQTVFNFFHVVVSSEMYSYAKLTSELIEPIVIVLFVYCSLLKQALVT